MKKASSFHSICDLFIFSLINFLNCEHFINGGDKFLVCRKQNGLNRKINFLNDF